MKLLQIYNQYRSLFGGEETVVRQIHQLVEKNGGEARLLLKSSRGLNTSIVGKSKAFVAGIYNPLAQKEVADAVEEFGPDVVHVHNLYPLFSPSILVTLRRLGVPVVMTVHNHLHTCPTADHLRDGKVCERCLGGREYHCLLGNCRGSLLESFGYALRNAVARRFRLFTENVTLTVALNEFARNRLVLAGFHPRRIVVLPNMVDIPPRPADAASGSLAVFSGRMCPEKGIDTLLEAGRRCPGIPIHFLGGGPFLEDYSQSAASNCVFHGQVDADKVVEYYRQARFIVVPSRWYEGCPLVILEAMSQGLPVIASCIGGLPELVENDINGILFTPGSADELADTMKALWANPMKCRALGAAGRDRAEKSHSEDRYWRELSQIYLRASEIVGRKAGLRSL